MTILTAESASAIRSSVSQNPAIQTPSRSSGPESLLARIGNTPLLDLSFFAQRAGVAPGVQLMAKAEWFNLSGSVKARPALRIVEEAEQRGELTPDKILIDSSSGNTAIAYAMIGAIKGYRVRLVMPANVSAERKALVKAYGAELVETDPLEGPDGAIQVVREMVAQEPERYFYANQYDNDANWRAHFATTGPEIWRQTQGRITHLVVGLGTTGTFTGVGRYLRQRNPRVQLVAIQPQDEMTGIEGLKHLATAIVPGIYDPTLADRFITVNAEAAWETSRRLAREAGLFVGFSAGAAVSCAIRVARELEEGLVVTVLPDDGSKYVSLGIFD